jgi:hypothetical protein
MTTDTAADRGSSVEDVHTRSTEQLASEHLRQLTSLDQKANSLIATTAFFFTGVSLADFLPLRDLHFAQSVDLPVVVKAILQFLLIIGAGLCLRCLILTRKNTGWPLEVPNPTEAEFRAMVCRLSHITDLRRRFFYAAYALLCVSLALMVCIYGFLLVSAFHARHP